MRLRRCALAVLGLMACTPAIPSLPSQGGPAWFELKSEHFRLWTDEPVERGRALINDLELRRGVIAAAMGRASSRAMAFVIAVRSTSEQAVDLPLRFAGAAWGPENPTGQPGILLSGDFEDRGHVVSYELAKVVSLGFFSNLPLWLSEAIASYFETVDVAAGDTSVKVGLPRPDLGDILRDPLPLTVPQLFACDEDRCKTGTFYAAGWAVFSLLVNEHYDAFARYLQRLQEIPPDAEDARWDGESSELAPAPLARERKRRLAQQQRAQAAAWRAAFPDLPPDKLDAELVEWLRTGNVRLPRIDVAMRAFPAAVRPLGDADVLAARSWLRYRYAHDSAATLHDAEAALALDRANVLARLVATAVTHQISPEDARAAAAAHPDDWRALRLVERALHGSPEAAQAHARLCAIAGDAAPECDRDRHRAEPAPPAAR